MGYTHYWRNLRFDDKGWEAVKGFSSKVFAEMAKRGVQLVNDSFSDEEAVPPYIGDDMIRFNGIGRDSHETFLLEKTGRDFEFCKTERKPYDLAASAILIFASSVSLDGTISSDGIGEKYLDGEWHDAWIFARLIDSDLGDYSRTFKAFTTTPNFDLPRD